MLWCVHRFPGQSALRYRLHRIRHPALFYRRAGLRALHHHRRRPERYQSPVPAAHRPQLYPAQVGLWSGTEPLWLQDRRGRAGGGPPVQRERSAAGYDLHGHRLHAGLRGFYRKQAALPGPCRPERRTESTGHPAGAHHRCGCAHRPGKPRLCRGPCKRFLLHQSRRHPLCGGGVAWQGLLCGLSAPGCAGVVRPAVQGTDRLRHRGLLERYERACAVLLTRAAQGFL